MNAAIIKWVQKLHLKSSICQNHMCILPKYHLFILGLSPTFSCFRDMTLNVRIHKHSLLKHDKQCDKEKQSCQSRVRLALLTTFLVCHLLCIKNSILFRGTENKIHPLFNLFAAQMRWPPLFEWAAYHSHGKSNN